MTAGALVWIGFWGSIGYALGSRKGEGLGGFIISAFLGPIGVLFVVISKPSPRLVDEMKRKDGNVQCKFCAEWIRKDALICKHCNREQSPAAARVAIPRPHGAPAGWQPDPFKRFPERWWNGHDWTGRVRVGAAERIESGW